MNNYRDDDKTWGSLSRTETYGTATISRGSEREITVYDYYSYRVYTHETETFALFFFFFVDHGVVMKVRHVPRRKIVMQRGGSVHLTSVCITGNALKLRGKKKKKKREKSTVILRLSVRPSFLPSLPPSFCGSIPDYPNSGTMDADDVHVGRSARCAGDVTYSFPKHFSETRYEAPDDSRNDKSTENYSPFPNEQRRHLFARESASPTKNKKTERSLSSSQIVVYVLPDK
ncbi:hypothetical protein PUN28_005526 [Cardiocondyla obscurior]|uniref:Uncharacterized protein n=1 Tax=Cardiocondyla obscurior TaxID=286306 RepID=A0AAW2GID3_9HYME